MSTEEKILLTERNSSSGVEFYYVHPPDQNIVLGVLLGLSVKDKLKQILKSFFRNLFLPQGYPNSVSEDYTAYQIWDTLQAFCSTITGILATQSVMKGVGVGDAKATPLAATITWVLKDGTGHIGRIAFAWYKGTSLDAESKKWRLIADILNDAAICIELALPFFSMYTTYILCLTTAMKAIVGVAGGATRAALTQHHAVRGNLADVAAKDGSQETAVNLIASFCAIYILSVVKEDAWPIFFIFTVLHLVFNYYAVTSVCLKTFNRSRFILMLDNYLKNSEISPPSVVNKCEPVLIGQNVDEKEFCGYNILLGHSLKGYVASKNITLEDFQHTLDIFKNGNYLFLVNNTEKCICVVFREGITSENILKSYYHATRLAMLLSAKPTNDKRSIYDRLKGLNSEAELDWRNLCIELTKLGWNLNTQLLHLQEWRADW